MDAASDIAPVTAPTGVPKGSRLCIVVPVFNDWDSLRILLGKLDAAAAQLPVRTFVVVVDDGSTEVLDEGTAPLGSPSSLAGVELTTLAVNMGHQRAIAIGLCVAVQEHDPDLVLVMDGDGEDPPERIADLLATAAGSKNFCVVAQRRKRTETLTFRAGYLLYKALFRLVTGREIDFGNFSLTSREYAERLVRISELWNNLPAALLRSRLPIQRVPIDRGHRYAGRSKMNFVSLFVHGFSGISAYAETIFVRLLLLTFCMGTFTVISIVVLLTLRVFYPAHATPGWATTVSFSLIIILVQILLTAMSSLLMLLNNRVQRLIVPVLEYRTYIRSRGLLAGALFAPRAE